MLHTTPHQRDINATNNNKGVKTYPIHIQIQTRRCEYCDEKSVIKKRIKRKGQCKEERITIFRNWLSKFLYNKYATQRRFIAICIQYTISIAVAHAPKSFHCHKKLFYYFFLRL